MDSKNEMGKSFNFSRASRTSDVEVNRELMKKYDEQRSKFVKLGKLQLGLFLIMFSFSLKLYVDGLWLWGSLTMLIALFALFRWYVYRNAAGGSAYTSGLLVPAVVVQTHPIELVALANVLCDDVEPEQLACKRFSVKNLPMHPIAAGERVPCMALFGGKEKGMWTNFEPRPLCWITEDAEAIRRNVERIEEREWDILSKIAGEMPAAGDDIVLLDADEQTGEVKIRMNKMEHRGVSFDYPETWKTEVEDLGEESCHIVCEKKGDNSQEIVTVTSEKSGKEDIAGKMETVLEGMRKQEVYANMHPLPFENTADYGFEEVLCRFTTDFSGVKYFGKIYVFTAAGKTFTILMQDEEDAFDRKFRFFTDSFAVS